MKEQTLLEMKNKVEATTRVLQQMINEIMHLRELGVGTLETVKLMPGYEEALEKLKENMLEKNRAEKAENEKEKDELPT
tara:strand:- start:286 stop:522 length:237 start_codon:yes stop_codon:yes gene_type:complete